MRVLVINTGSSSVRYALFDDRHALKRGKIDGVDDYRRGLDGVIDALRTDGVMEAPDAIAHRVVHGGTEFNQAVVVDDEVIAVLRTLSQLAPLHNPANLTGIAVCREVWPEVPQIAVFDTAFHQSLPPAAASYALPRELCERHGLRRYGFHGLSHQYLARAATRVLGRDAVDTNLITLHLGNGASATAIRGGDSVETSMGFTPLEGLVMGTRSGDIDPSIPGHLARYEGADPDAVDAILNTKSGLKGLCGAQDMREVLSLAGNGDGQAQLAIDMYVHRIRKYVGAYFAVLGHVHALVFSGGVGENHPWVWRAVCRDLNALGIGLDPGRPAGNSPPPWDIASAGSRVRVLVIRTDEESEIARQTLELLQPG